MMKKVLIGLGALMLVTTIAWFLMPKAQAPAQQAQQQPEKNANAKPWNGQATRVYNASFVRQGRELTLIDVSFSHLNTPRTDVSFRFMAPRSAKTVIPRWLKPNVFIVRSTSGQSWLPSWTPKAQGAVITFTVKLDRLPTAQIARNGLGLVVRMGARPFSIGVTPPAAPAGHRFGEKKKRPDTKKPSLALTRVNGGFRIVAKDDVALKRVTVNINGSKTVYRSAAPAFAKTVKLKKAKAGKAKKRVIKVVVLDASGKRSPTKTLVVRR